MFGLIKEMKAQLKEFHKDFDKSNEITFGKMIEQYFSDLKYFECLLEDKKEVFDLYVSSVNDDIQSVETSEEEKLKENVEKLYEIFCLDVDLDKDEFYDDDKYKMYEKVVKIIKDFENSETYKNLYDNSDFIYTDGKKPELQPFAFTPLELNYNLEDSKYYNNYYLPNYNLKKHYLN